MFAILFGLSMDYEVFLLSRIREDWLDTGDAHGSVVRGLSATGRVISAAAAIMVAVFLGFASEVDVVVKQLGVGMAVAILLDATVVRMVLVPATMTMLGKWNWWMPAWLDRALPTVRAEVTDLDEPDARPDDVHPHARRRADPPPPSTPEGEPRMSTTLNSTTTPPTAWPAQLRLPGQTAAPEGPVDMFMMYVMHHAFRRDLAALTEAAAVHAGRPTGSPGGCSQQRWEVFAEALHGHHSGEDAGLWPLLLERGTDDDVETLEAMEAEHAEFDPLLEACAAGFARLAEHADDDARAALAVRLAATRECLAPAPRARGDRAPSRSSSGCSPRRTGSGSTKEHFKEDLRLGQGDPGRAVGAYGVPATGARRRVRQDRVGFKVIWLVTRRGSRRREARRFRHVRLSGPGWIQNP